MTEGNSKQFEMAVGSSNVLEAGMMEGENFYTPIESADVSESASQSNWSGGKPPDTGQLCRSCANTSDYLIPIYEGEGLEHQLEYKIQKHLPIQSLLEHSPSIKLMRIPSTPVLSMHSVLKPNSFCSLENPNRTFITMLSSRSTLGVSSSDALPLQLCYQCASTLIAWDTMINSCLEADRKLKAMLEVKDQSKTKEIFEDSQVSADTDLVDSDDEPLIASKEKLLSEKEKAAPIKKKILSKAKSKTDKTATNSKEEDRERRKPSRKNGSEKTDEKKQTSKKDKKSEKKDEKVVENEKQNHYGNVIPQLEEKDIFEILDVEEKSLEKSLICHICAKEFRKYHLLQAHIRRVHYRIVVAKCKICGRDFRDTSNYTSHMKIHSEVKSYVCQNCGKCFAQLQGLKIHHRTHTLNFPYLCMVCGRRYRTKQHLEQHASAHSEERPFDCDVCGKSFKTRLHLKGHSWVHSDKFRYYCSYCQKGFNNTSHLKLHVKNHHVEVDFVPPNAEIPAPASQDFFVTSEALQEDIKSVKIVTVL